MQIKRYLAPTMREAIAQVREEQGPDAVILSNRRVEEGMEVIAAVDYDETLIARALAQAAGKARPSTAQPATRAVSSSAATVTAPVAAAAAASTTAASAYASAVPPPQSKLHAARKSEPVREPARGAHQDEKAAASNEPAIMRMRDEMHTLRQMLETQLAGIAWGELGRRDPLKAKALRDLAALDIHPQIAREIVQDLPQLKTLRESWKVPLALLTRRIPIAKTNPFEEGGVMAVVGPTGVGKTTTIAKLAARFALKYGARNVAMVSTDTYRIGAREQLHTYARILNVPMHVVQDREDLAHVLGALSGRKLILIDTAGMSQRDMRLNEQFETLRHEGTRIDVVLALSAAGDAGCLDETVRLFTQAGKSNLAGCILTKLDEAAGLGAPLSVLIRHGLPMLYLCTGQRVPEDLHLAHGKHAWLVERAVKLRRQSGRLADEDFLADQYGKVAAYA